MATQAPIQPSESAMSAQASGASRQRQRERFSPRGRSTRTNPAAATSRDTGRPSQNEIKLWPAPRTKNTSKPLPDLSKDKQMQEGMRKGNSLNSRGRGEVRSRNDIAPDGSSAGREGRQFTVANVGNNGRIYLRPTIRPANQRYPQPSFVFPMTPPITAGLDTLVSKDNDDVENNGLWTPTQSPSTPAKNMRDQYFQTRTSPAQRPHHRRALSHSTIDKQLAPVRDSDVGAFKVVIERPGTKPREPEYPAGVPTLEVPIPTYRLGTPRFSMRGTAFFRNLSFTTTDDMRSSILSDEDFYQRHITSSRPSRLLSRRHSDASPQANIHSISPSPPKEIRQHSPFAPEVYDTLTFKPGCDHISVVRYGLDGAIRAASPARLIAEITSPTYVDYDLLSDFFLTFRSYLNTSDLLHMLISRLKWALARSDEVGTVVRVRTFVAVRHWILNYFLDDYVIDWDLRKAFCELVNNFVEDLLRDQPYARVPLKIIGELKKCWRRVCALYWDGAEFQMDLGLEAPILPGGVAGSRDPKLDPSFWDKYPSDPPLLKGMIESDYIEPDMLAQEDRNYFAEVSKARHVDSAGGPARAPRTVYTHRSNEVPPLSPTSIKSEDVVSCSLPPRARVVEAQPLGAHPVPASSVYESSGPVATTPKALTGKRVRPTHAHKRSGSFSDSFRDQQYALQKIMYKNNEILLALPHAGSLVRGNLFPPGQALVEVIAPSTPAEASRVNSLFPPPVHKGPSAMSGPGMKKLLGSVRRALSTRAGTSPNASPTQGSFPHIPPLGIRGATINRLPGTAVVPQERPRHTAPMRIDLLGAEIAEHFKKAVREDAEADAERRRGTDQQSSRGTEHVIEIDYSTMHMDTTPNPRAPTSEMTTDNKPIVIDDLPPKMQVMSGALPLNASDDNFADAYIHPSGGPTPPTTPPEFPLGTPRRSSHLLGLTPRKPSTSLEGTPASVLDSRPSYDNGSPPNRPLARRPSMRPLRPSYKSKRSVLLGRYASYHSGFTIHRSQRSFDASTFSELEDGKRLSDVPSAPRPLRVLRRRPGGDLRAATNIGDLNTHSLRRPMSTGSLTTYSDSVRSSYFVGGESGGYVNVANSDFDQSHTNPQTFSLGALAEASPKDRVSLFSTHSSHPMRPSFEKEAQMLAQIPDDDGDGGVECALAKLEGKYEQRRSDISAEDVPYKQPVKAGSFGASPLDVSTLTLEDEEQEKRKHRREHIVKSKSLNKASMVQEYRPQTPANNDTLKPAVYRPTGMQYPASVPSAPRSHDSYNSTPLLDRVSTEGRNFRPQDSDWSEHSVPRGPSNERSEGKQSPKTSLSSSFDFINRDSANEAPGDINKNNRKSGAQSFLDSASDAGRSDLSSELSIDVISRTEFTRHDSTSTQAIPTIRVETTIKEAALPSHPLRHPPSPPITLTEALSLSPNSTDAPQVYEKQLQRSLSKRLPPSPEISPTGAAAEKEFRGDRVGIDPIRSHTIPEPSRRTSAHLPFTLAFDSQVLAQQFTLIEKDALNEIDWKDLIEMHWKDSHTESRSWVEFLHTSEPRGVEVVIARFNIMVKWALSECVLTQNLEERVRCISKYIHIAAHCRKYRNFATMTQLTVALTSKDITRLTKTWACVPASDIQTLRELEELVTPTSNFHSLRAEMEGAGAGEGCIPFVGIYTHDLLVNSERPSQIASTPITEPLVNFEKCRANAAIVKNLLRLLEASQLYRFLPIEGVTERCLWMAALSDEEIARYGNLIER